MTESNVGSGNISRMRRRPEVERREAQARFDKKTLVHHDGRLQQRTRRQTLLERLRAVTEKRL